MDLSEAVNGRTGGRGDRHAEVAITACMLPPKPHVITRDVPLRLEPVRLEQTGLTGQPRGLCQPQPPPPMPGARQSLHSARGSDAASCPDQCRAPAAMIGGRLISHLTACRKYHPNHRKRQPMGNGSARMRVRLKGVNTVRRYRTDGSFALYHYHRVTGRPLEGVPGSPEFIASYAAAEKSIRDRAKGTIADLIRRFEASPEFANMREGTTQKEYRRKFKVIDPKWGSAPIAAFNDKEFRVDALNWRDAVAKRARR